MMRRPTRLTALTLFAILILTLTACSGKKMNTIQVADLSEREEAILSTFANDQMIFDFRLRDEFKGLSIWVEKYESGQKTEERFIDFTAQVEQEGTIIFGISSVEGNRVVHVAGQSEERTSSVTVPELDTNDLEKMARMSGPFTGDSDWDGKERVLGDICYSAGPRMQGLSTDFYDDPASHVDELKQYEVAYLLKAEAKK